jgi:hypothetical protein
VIVLPKRIRGLSTQVCYCPEKCTGVDNQGCKNSVPDFTLEHSVQLSTGRGLDSQLKYLTVRTDIPVDTFITTLGGSTVQVKTQPRALVSFTWVHVQQHEKEDAQKFQYSVQVGSKGLADSTACLIPPNHKKIVVVYRINFR